MSPACKFVMAIFQEFDGVHCYGSQVLVNASVRGRTPRTPPAAHDINVIRDVHN